MRRRIETEVGAAVLSGVRLWNAVSWSAHRSPRRRLRTGIGRPGWVVVAAIAVGGWIGRRAALGVDGGVLAKGGARMWSREGGLGGVRAGSRSWGTKSWPGAGVARAWVWRDGGAGASCCHRGWVGGGDRVRAVGEAGGAPCRRRGRLRFRVRLLLTCRRCRGRLLTPQRGRGSRVLTDAC